MRARRRIRTALVAVAMTWGCGRAEPVAPAQGARAPEAAPSAPRAAVTAPEVSAPVVFQPKPLDGMKEVPAAEHTRKLDAEVTAFLRNRYVIASARYFDVPGPIPWIAVSKSVQNQMAERSIQRTDFEWYEPGLDFVAVYPQGEDGAAFALAMPKGTKGDADKLVGYYVLRRPR